MRGLAGAVGLGVGPRHSPSARSTSSSASHLRVKKGCFLLIISPSKKVEGWVLLWQKHKYQTRCPTGVLTFTKEQTKFAFISPQNFEKRTTVLVDHPDQRQVQQHPRQRREPDLRGPGWGVGCLLDSGDFARSRELSWRACDVLMAQKRTWTSYF